MIKIRDQNRILAGRSNLGTEECLRIKQDLRQSLKNILKFEKVTLKKTVLIAQNLAHSGFSQEEAKLKWRDLLLQLKKTILFQFDKVNNFYQKSQKKVLGKSVACDATIGPNPVENLAEGAEQTLEFFLKTLKSAAIRILKSNPNDKFNLIQALKLMHKKKVAQAELFDTI